MSGCQICGESIEAHQDRRFSVIGAVHESCFLDYQCDYGPMLPEDFEPQGSAGSGGEG